MQWLFSQDVSSITDDSNRLLQIVCKDQVIVEAVLFDVFEIYLCYTLPGQEIKYILSLVQEAFVSPWLFLLFPEGNNGSESPT